MKNNNRLRSSKRSSLLRGCLGLASLLALSGCGEASSWEAEPSEGWQLTGESDESNQVLSVATDSSDATRAPQQAQELSIHEVNEAVRPGQSGSNVRAVYDFLHRHGYFHNDELKEQHPNWFPVVRETPDPNHYDEVLEKAVRAYQRLSGLEQTGEVENPTLELMKQPRCGHPDIDLTQVSGDEKFWSGPDYWPSGSDISYGFINDYTSGMKGVVRGALQKWQDVTNLTFTENTSNPGGADLQFKVKYNRGGNALASASSLGTVIIAATVSLHNPGSTNTWPNRLTGLKKTALHEIGHAIGLQHTSYDDTVMHQPAHVDTLSVDDALSASVAYSYVEKLPSSRKAWRLSAAEDSVWRLSRTQRAGGWEISRWTESSGWQTATTSFGASEIAAVSNTSIYFISETDGWVYRWDNVFGGGSPAPVAWLGGGSIAYGGGELWGLWGLHSVEFGRWVYQLNNGTWEGRNGIATSLAVEDTGLAWVSNGQGDVYRFNGSSWDQTITNPHVEIGNLDVRGTHGQPDFALWGTSLTDDDDDTLLWLLHQEGSKWVQPRHGLFGGWVTVGALGQPWTTSFEDFRVRRQRRD